MWHGLPRPCGGAGDNKLTNYLSRVRNGVVNIPTRSRRIKPLGTMTGAGSGKELVLLAKEKGMTGAGGLNPLIKGWDFAVRNSQSSAHWDPDESRTQNSRLQLVRCHFNQ